MNDISWSHYSGVNGFGQGSQNDVDQLNKALTVGNAINPPAQAVPGDGFSMRVESLERTLKNTTFKMDNIVFWKSLPKLPAFNTVEEHNEISSYGVNPDAGFFAEGALPAADDSTYARRFAMVKFLGTTRAVSHVGTLIKPAHGDIIAQETVAGTMHILRMLSRYLWWGDSTLSPLQFDGFLSLINQRSPAANIIDMRGQPLTEDKLCDGALTIQDAPNYGVPTHLVTTPKTKADLVKTFFPKERFDALNKPANGMVGLDIKGFTSPAGDIEFMGDVFLNDIGNYSGVAVGNPTVIPGAPTITTPAAATADPLSMFGAADAGLYYYTVVAVNQYGRSAPVVVNSSALAVAQGQSVTFAVTPAGIAAGWYEVYRTPVNAAANQARLILRIPAATTGATTITDENNNLPGCSNAVMFQLNLEAVSWKQLCPLVKIPLAVIDTSIRFALALYGVPVLYTPGKIVLYKNIGRTPGYVGQP